MQNYQQNAVRKTTQYATTGKVIYDEFYPRHAKPIMDQIDATLAAHYALTEPELDAIANYDHKYRTGGPAE